MSYHFDVIPLDLSTPRFFRYGEGGRNKKKSNNRGFTQKDEGGVVDEQFRQRYK